MYLRGERREFPNLFLSAFQGALQISVAIHEPKLMRFRLDRPGCCGGHRHVIQILLTSDRVFLVQTPQIAWVGNMATGVASRITFWG